ncbi:hypothetical protein AX774_g5923 [Zancudomyces culisetae]|uniref:Uncharacterized protein n=1 Tax=Zancudomyces culisetae TaxID=1213189 RepID=A0A1R1PI34_ZANCU|nr:hypothetical protein AX774_g5923 [Zancudomyces culisetae]|eukprot:OMH80641.1 hypothetical protein AX774_g5923 [Zancudomyces culisetae]
MVNIVGFGVNFEKLGNESNNENGENDNNGGDDDSNQGGGSQSCSSKLDKNLNSLEKKEKDKNDSRSYTKEDTNQDLFIEDSDDGDGSDITICEPEENKGLNI